MSRGKKHLATNRSARTILPTANFTVPETMLCLGEVPLSEVASAKQIEYLRKAFVPLVTSAFAWHEETYAIHQLMKSPLVMRFVQAEGELFEKVGNWLNSPNPRLILGKPDKELNQIHAYEFYALSSILFAARDDKINDWQEWRQVLTKDRTQVVTSIGVGEAVPVFDVCTKLLKTIELGLSNITYQNATQMNKKDAIALIDFWDTYGETIIYQEMVDYEDGLGEDDESHPTNDVMRAAMVNLYDVMLDDRQISGRGPFEYKHRVSEKWLAMNYYTAQHAEEDKNTGTMTQLFKPLFEHCSYKLSIDERELANYLERCLKAVKSSAQKLDPDTENNIRSIIERCSVS